MRVKILCGTDFLDLEGQINSFIKSIPDSDIKIKYDFGRTVAVIEYTGENQNRLCCECRFWDDSNGTDGLIGLCQRCGGRRRFNNRACNEYIDVRG